MESVVPQERYIDCPYCYHPVSSYEAFCSKCGLEASAEGIEELAQIEEQIFRAINDADGLKLIAIFPFYFSFLSLFYFFMVDRQAIWFNLPLWVSYVYFIIAFVSWHRKYSELVFEPDELEKIRNDKRAALTFIAYSVILGFGLIVLFR